MKKSVFISLVVALFVVFISNQIKAQTYAEYYAQFPTITTKTTWDNATILAYPESNKPKLDQKFYGLVGGKGNGKGKWGTADAYTSRQILYPLGKIETGSSVIVFVLALSGSYVADDNTQMSIDAFCYEKKTGNLLRGGINFYLIAYGGDVKYGKFMYKGNAVIDPKTLSTEVIEQDGKSTKRTYKFKSSGLDLTSY